MHQIIALPESVRQVIMSFVFFEHEEGVQSIARKIDFSDATRRQIMAVTSGRLPGKASQPIGSPPFNAKGAFVRALSSPEFQTRIREIVLASFPEKRRLINLHIPKCAGTDLEIALKRRHPFLHHTMSIPEATPKPDLFAALRLLALGMQFSDAIAITGHVHLEWYLKHGLIRVQDDVFTTIREPRERIYSQISYMLTTMVNFRGTSRHDTAGWLAAIGMDDLEADPSPGYLLETGRRLLRSRTIMRPNEICGILGDGTAETAIANLVVADAEITDMQRYSAWRTSKFKFSPPDRINKSRPLFTDDLANTADRQIVDGLIEQDVVLYDSIQRVLGRTDLLSVRGRALT